MKNKLCMVGIAVTGAALSVLASPFYTTLSDGGNPASPAQVIFPADPATTPRLVAVNYTSDTNNATLALSSGIGAYVTTGTNTSSGATQAVNSVTGLIPGKTLVLQQGGVCYSAVLSSTNNATNAVLAAGGWGVAPVIGSDVYLMGAAIALPIGAATNSQNGVALYVGSQGRPMMLVLSPALGTNNINSAVAHYD